MSGSALSSHPDGKTKMEGASVDSHVPVAPAAAAAAAASQSEVQQQNEIIKLQVKQSARYQRTSLVKIRRTSPLGAMMEFFAAQAGRHVDRLRFVTFDGQRMHKDQTANDLELEDGDLIDVLEEQDGGGGGQVHLKVTTV
ncbi:hypothetical protein PFICI_04909 [Pestalotiopsis fici W106-1]|uniref:Ubiquitin-like domain-containing protein n=1 Tax=Pestalotiopsis fici (strain W106-1 / CGMCC3.15140) TaxID=1229662 RepID=W3XAA2_PESFW|nr:uncharacterized protein PFICI_04909 [Pestalotiopsis fici W106-1]ETS83033.1 hypothetical protein PFICI_04909 [Pestalotiopsis fici W106-1]